MVRSRRPAAVRRVLAVASRASAIALLVAIVGACASTRTTPGDRLEVLIQQGLASAPEYIHVYETGEQVFLEAYAGLDRRIWTLRDGGWTLLRRWDDVVGRHPLTSRAEGPQVLVMRHGDDRVAVTDTGDLGRTQTLRGVNHRRLLDVRDYIGGADLPRFAARYRDDDDKRTIVFEARSPGAWTRASIPDLVGPAHHVDALGTTTPTFLVKGTWEGGGETASWRRFDPTKWTWRPLAWPVDGVITRRWSYDAQRLLGLKSGRGYHLFDVRPDGSLAPIHSLLGIPPAEVATFGPADGGAPAIFARAKGAARNVDLVWLARRPSDGRFAPAHEVFAAPFPLLDTIEGHADGLAVTLREREDADGDGVPGAMAFRVLHRGAWRPLDQALPSAPPRVWRLDGVEGADVLGVQDLHDSDGDGLEYEWHWWARAADDTWQSAEDQLGLPAPSRVRGLSLEREVLTVEIVEGESTRIARYLRRAKGWRPLADLLRDDLAAGHEIDAVREGGAAAIVTLRGAGGAVTRRYLARIADRWRVLEQDLLVRPRAATADREAGRHRTAKEPLFVDGTTRALRLANATARSGTGSGGRADARETSPPLLLERDRGRWTIGTTPRGARISPTDARAGGALVRTSEGRVQRWRVRGPRGWIDLADGLPSPPTEIVHVKPLAAGEVLAVDGWWSDGGSGRALARRFYARAADGGWRPLVEVVADLPATVEQLTALDDDAFRVDGRDAKSERTHRHVIRTPAAGWQAVSIEGLPPTASTVRYDADVGIVSARDEFDSDGDGASWEWHHLVRESEAAGVRWRPLAEVLPDLAETRGALRPIWGGRGVVLSPDAADRAGVTVLERVGERWQIVAGLAGADDAVDVLADAVGRVIAFKTLGSTDAPPGARYRWTVSLRSGPGAPWRPVPAEGPGQETRAVDVLTDPTSPIVGLAVDAPHATLKRSAAWRWYSLDGGSARHLGTSTIPGWTGIGETLVPDGRVRYDVDVHVLDGLAVDGLPPVNALFHTHPRGTTIGAALNAPELVPDGVDVYGAGPSEQLFVYRRAGRRLAVMATDGALTFRRLPVAGGGHLEVLVNTLPDGSERIHVAAEPTRWIRAYPDPATDRRIYWDDFGFFYSELADLTERLSFRVGDQVYTFGQLGRHLFRPDQLEVALAVPIGSLFQLTPRDHARLERARRLAPNGVHVATLQPPRISLRELPPAAVEADAVTLKIDAVGRGITADHVSVHVLGAGRARSARRPPATDGQQRVSVTRQVPLLPGPNVIDVRVDDAEGLSHTRTITVDSRPPAARKPRLFAVLVSVSDYDAPGLTSLPLTAADSRTVAELLGEQQGGHFEEVRVARFCTRGDGCRRPDRRGLDAGVPAFFADAQHGDQLLFYASAHGVRADGGYYLVPQDGDPADPTSLVSWDRIRGWLTGAPNLGKRVVVLDTCNAGAAQGDPREKRRLVQQSVEYDGIYLLTATARDAKAFELSSLGNGLFTYVIAEGFYGMADVAPVDGVVGFEELAAHVAERGRVLSAREGVRQEPPIFPLLTKGLDFGVGAVIERYPVHVLVTEASGHPATPSVKARWEAALAAAVDKLYPTTSAAPHTLSLVLRDDGSTSLRLLDAQGEPRLDQTASGSPEEVARAVAGALVKTLGTRRCKRGGTGALGRCR